MNVPSNQSLQTIEEDEGEVSLGVAGVERQIVLVDLSTSHAQTCQKFEAEIMGFFLKPLKYNVRLLFFFVGVTISDRVARFSYMH